MPDLDLDLLAYDIADMLDRYEYPVTGSQDDIRAALPAFLAAIESHANSQPGEDAATWTPPADDPAVPTSHHGRAPHMTYFPWQRSQRVELGATDVHAWYWRCPLAGCRIWSGTYDNGLAAKHVGFQHEARCWRLSVEKRRAARDTL